MNGVVRQVAENGLLKTWGALSMVQRGIAIAATVGTIVVCVALFGVATKEGEALLFAGLEPSAAGEVAAQLDGDQIPYSIRGSAIYVPVSMRDRLRLEMARQGLPAAGNDGYEILDDLNGFSTTADMFDAAYWRAKEGELTRTIMAMPAVKGARVHLGVTRQSAFRRTTEDKSASVTVEAPGGLSKEQAQSIQYLTALAVPSLSPAQVAVIDTQRGVIAGPGAGDPMMAGTDPEGRAAELELRLMRLLEAHVGVGNARVTVAMEVDRETVAQTERLIDPDSRQIVSRKLVEERDTEERPGGTVTVASNLPDGPDAEEAEEPPVLRSRRNEEVVYTGTEIERTMQRAPGEIQKLSVAILLNERTTIEGGQAVPSPRSAEELADLEALVTSAAGINPERGDMLTLRTLPFNLPEVEVTQPSFVETQVAPRAVEIGQILFLGMIAVILGLFVVKPLLTSSGAGGEGEEGRGAIPHDAASLLTMLTEENPDNAAAILDAWFEDEAETVST